MNRPPNSQSGNVLFIIFIAVALIAALTMALMSGGGDQAISMSADRISQELRAQAQSIRSAIVECDLVNNYGYPPASEEGKDVKDI